MSKNAAATRTPDKAKVARTAPVRRTGSARGAGKRSGRAAATSGARWPFIAFMAVAAIMSAVVAYAVRNQDGSGGGAGASGGFGHVHGLAVDDGGSGLLVATHFGLYRVTGEHSAVRVSKESPDLMGFTAAGSGRFLASGHPGDHDDGPANLGLLRSTDGGVTWTTMSLSGAADFHGLRSAHGAVYGYNSTDGAFMVSTDERTWQRRSTVALGAFVVSPVDPDRVVGVGRTGLQHSADGGRSWHQMAGTPQFTAMAWEQPTQVWGAAPDGAVWRSEDSGDTWRRLGTLPGEPTALAVHDGAVFAALDGDRIMTSTDGAATWTARYSPA